MTQFLAHVLRKEIAMNFKEEKWSLYGLLVGLFGTVLTVSICIVDQDYNTLIFATPVLVAAWLMGVGGGLIYYQEKNQK